MYFKDPSTRFNMHCRRVANWGYSADHADLEVGEHSAEHVLNAQGLVVKNVDVAEVRIVIAAVLLPIS